MPIFVSYSHQDREFATRLASQLVKHRAHVWIDDWELQVGDPIIERIERAIEGATALLVVLSNAFVESEWCRKELSAGLLKELEERRVFVLPVLIEDCEIPLLLRAKKYADFRTDFDSGLHQVLNAVARLTSVALGRVEEPTWHVDWSIDWGEMDDRAFMRITLLDQARDAPYSCITEVRIIANEEGTKQLRKLQERDLAWFGQLVILEGLAEGTYDKELRVLLQDQTAKTTELTLADGKSGKAYEVVLEARRLGEDTGRDILLDLGEQLRRIRDALRATGRKLTPEEMKWIQGANPAME